MREDLLRQVWARLERFNTDPTVVLAPDAVTEVTALLESVPDPDKNLEVAHTAGWLRWARYLASEPEEDQQELTAALLLFAPVYQIRPDTVPDWVREFFDQNNPERSDLAQAGAQAAVDLLSETLRTGDPTALNTAIGLLRQVVDATPTDHPGRAAILSNLGAALRTRFGRTGALADLDAAINTSQAAVDTTATSDPDRAGYLSNLCGALLTRFGRTGALADLDAAINTSQQALTAIPTNLRRPAYSGQSI